LRPPRSNDLIFIMAKKTSKRKRFSVTNDLRLRGKILILRNEQVMIDKDLAELYGVTTKRLNEQVRRNMQRFPEDFMFQLSEKEKTEVVANCDHLQSLKYSPSLPYAFSEHGVVMLATVLNSPLAVTTSIQLVRAFILYREILTGRKDVLKEIRKLEKKYDAQFKDVFDAIDVLMEDPKPKKRPIGFLLKA
jgi:hypothetical protein